MLSYELLLQRFPVESAIEMGATAIPIPLKWLLPLEPIAVEAHL